jgi:chromodomain-helicase-DNA-binding protein 4
MNFIDPEGWNNLEQLERQYRQEHLTKELLSELHLKLKEYFLRRTKEILKLPNKVF